MTQQEIKDLIATVVAEQTQPVAPASPPQTVHDRTRRNFVIQYLIISTMLLVLARMFFLPAVIPAFCNWFVAGGLFLWWLIDLRFFPNADSFEAINGDARATSNFFLALSLLISAGIFAGAAIVQQIQPPAEGGTDDERTPATRHESRKEDDTLARLPDASVQRDTGKSER